MSQEAEISAETSILAKASIATSSLDLGATPSLLHAPEKWARKRRHFHVLVK